MAVQAPPGKRNPVAQRRPLFNELLGEGQPEKDALFFHDDWASEGRSRETEVGFSLGGLPPTQTNLARCPLRRSPLLAMPGTAAGELRSSANRRKPSAFLERAKTIGIDASWRFGGAWLQFPQRVMDSPLAARSIARTRWMSLAASSAWATCHAEIGLGTIQSSSTSLRSACHARRGGRNSWANASGIGVLDDFIPCITYGFGGNSGENP